MIRSLQDAREVGELAAVLASWASEEGKPAMASCLSAISKAALSCTDPSDLTALRAELRSAYAALYAPKENGLADLFRWHDDAEIRRSLNVELEKARSRLDELLEYTP